MHSRTASGLLSDFSLAFFFAPGFPSLVRLSVVQQDGTAWSRTRRTERWSEGRLVGLKLVASVKEDASFSLGHTRRRMRSGTSG